MVQSSQSEQNWQIDRNIIIHIICSLI
jgi:hypothetical protein